MQHSSIPGGGLSPWFSTHTLENLTFGFWEYCFLFDSVATVVVYLWDCQIKWMELNRKWCPCSLTARSSNVVMYSFFFSTFNVADCFGMSCIRITERSFRLSKSLWAKTLTRSLFLFLPKVSPIGAIFRLIVASHGRKFGIPSLLVSRIQSRENKHVLEMWDKSKPAKWRAKLSGCQFLFMSCSCLGCWLLGPLGWVDRTKSGNDSHPMQTIS